jgi:hypothetical protein
MDADIILQSPSQWSNAGSRHVRELRVLGRATRLKLPTSVVITGCNSLPVLPANSPLLSMASEGQIE